MSVRLNLLPDLRQAKLREQSRRRMATTIVMIVCVSTVAITVVMGIYNGTQKLLIKSTSADITKKMDNLNSKEVIDALTIQQHLDSLPALYGQRVYLSHFFRVYTEGDPTAVSLSSLSIDSSNTLKVNGVSATFSSVSKLARALAADNITVGSNAKESNKPYFTNVAIKSISQASGKITFSLTATVSSAALQSGANSNGNK